MHTILIPSAIPPNNILISTQELIINTYDYFNKDISMRHEPVAVIKNKPAFDNFCDNTLCILHYKIEIHA